MSAEEIADEMLGEDLVDEEPKLGFEVFEDPATMNVIGHPLRMRAYVEAVKHPVSAKELAEQLGVPLPRISYHVRALADAGLLRPVRRTRRRGAVETHYRAIATLEMTDEFIANAPAEVLRMWVSAIVRLVSEDAIHAIEGSPELDQEIFVARAHFVVDAAGRERLNEVVRSFYLQLADLERELRVEPGEGAEEVNLSITYHEGVRYGGRNSPVMFGIRTGNDEMDTIPPD